MIQIKGLRAAYGIKFIEGFTLKEGESLAIIGPNGAGKSTLLKLIFGLMKPIEGDVLLNGKSTGAPHTQHQMSFMPTYEDRIAGLTVTDSVALGFSAQRGVFTSLTTVQNAAIKSALQQFELWTHRTVKVNTLSAGQYQRVRLARQFALNRDILVMDEPFSYLDPQHIASTTQLFYGLKAQEKTLIITSQQLNHAARCCEKMVILDNGRLVDFGPSEEIMSSKNLKHVFKTNFVTVSHPRCGATQILYPSQRDNP